MKAISIGLEGSLELVDTECPSPKPGELLIRVEATAVNRADILQRRGKYPPPPGASEILGLEISGTVEALGSGCSNYAVGDKIFGLVPGGGYAQFATIDEQMAMPLPRELTTSDAAALPEAFLTAFQALFCLGGLDSRQLATAAGLSAAAPGTTRNSTVLIHAGASGVGSAAIQLAKLAGAKVISTSSAEKASFCREIGSDMTINGYDLSQAKSQIEQYCQSSPLEIILDCIGPSLLAPHLELLGVDGRLVTIGLLGGTTSDSSSGVCDLKTYLPLILKRRLQLIGTTLRNRSLVYQRALTTDLAHFLIPLIELGKLRPIIHSHLPLAMAQEAHRILEARENLGKVILEVTH